jgi:hypothetical protein
MSERKQTPDVLADLLGASTVASEPRTTQNRSPRAAEARRSAPAKSSEPAKAADKIHRWEYLVVSFQEYRGWRPRYEGGVEIAGWVRGPLLHNYLEERGRAGWELVAASSGKPMFGVTDYYQLFFRRPAG